MRQTEQIEWVPVEEGLPQYAGEHLVTMIDGYCLEATFGNGMKWWYRHINDVTNRVIAWANMPQGYTPKAGD